MKNIIFVFLIFIWVVCSSAHIYYVDADSGNDTNSGISPLRAWATLNKVNSTLFTAGDQILFKAGTRYTGQLEPKGSGTDQLPIVISQYGSGEKPAIDGFGQKLHTILLHNIEYWKVKNLEITNTGKERMSGRRGIIISAENFGDCQDILSHQVAAAGIWPWSSDHTLIQFNEVSNHRAKWDGQGFDSDYNCRGTIIQYNYSHDNFGGFLLIYNNGQTYGTYGNIGNDSTIIRYNVSINDGIRPYPTLREGWFSPILHITGPVKNTLIYNNLILVPKRDSAQIDQTLIKMNNWGGLWPNNLTPGRNAVHFNVPDYMPTFLTLMGMKN